MHRKNQRPFSEKETKKGCKSFIFLQPFEFLLEAASGFEPENNGFAGCTMGNHKAMILFWF